MLLKTHKKIVAFVLVLLYFLQVNIAQRIGIEHKYFNYFILIIGVIYFFIYKPHFYRYKYVFFISLASIVVIGIRIYLGMFEETIQTLFCVIFPALFYMLIVHDEGNRKNQLYVRDILLSFFIINSSIAIIEMLVRSHLIGWVDSTYSEGVKIYAANSTFRSVALAGAPLNNALLTTILNLYILFSDIKIKKKFLLFGLGYVAILAFNARAAIVVNAIAFFFYYIKEFSHLSMRQKGFSLFALLFLFLGVLFLIFNTNMGSRLLETESLEDDGSIAVRLRLFEKISELDYKQFIWGDKLSNVRLLMEYIGVAIIENFWICYILHLGIAALVVFTYLYYKLICKIFRGLSRYDSFVIAFCFILLASSNNSLYSGYTPLLTFLLGGYAFKTFKQIN